MYIVDFKRITEQPSLYNNLEQMTTHELLSNINKEDQSVPLAIERAIGQIERVVDTIVMQLQSGGRLFYIGAGTSGRLGILDASECPPTYGVQADLVIGLIAGGDQAIRYAVENAEDDPLQGWYDLEAYDISSRDVVVGIAASGSTPYVVKAMEKCRLNAIPTACITCNPNSPLANAVNFPIEVIVGPEFVTGSSRMKAGTAQKLVLNMLSTSTMIKLGKVKGNKMVDMKMTNSKLQLRGAQMIVDELHIPLSEAITLLEKHQNVRQAIESYKSN